MCQIFSFQQKLSEKKNKIKPVQMLRKIAVFYLLAGIVLLMFFGIGFNSSGWLFTIGIGSLIAAVQTYLIGAMIHAIYLFQHKREASPTN
jgi:membrane protein YdbS with pleckstrin-like domain